MVNLIRNENMKLYRRWRTWIMVAFMIGAVLLGSILEWRHDGRKAQGDGWRAEVTEQKSNYQRILEDPQLDPETRTYFKEQMLIADYQLANDIRTEEGTMWDGINGSAGLVVLITLFTVIVAGDSLAGEFTSGTIKLLLIRPASRLKILISKYLSLLMFSFLLLVVLFVVSVLVNGLLFQFGFVDLPLLSVNGEGVVVEGNMVAHLWKSYLLNGITTVMYVSMAFMISAAFRSSAMAIGFSIAALFAGTVLMELLQRYEWSKYLLFPNLDLTPYLTANPYQDGMTLTFSIVVLCVYFLVFNLVSWLVFTRRDVAA
ncbi:hypothetical protein SY83_10360 [Paenibacillus swuensis]|uniref:ABC transporter permease n=1 Tax=Paenibacillus swuensis TaxID=1178515 RepID=A0A172THS8_9BACL|nr:ABC transporter permease [Paenibacillus swuensis]ANE46608.1 hypothetical protein SY83_10360 [Paenibacillus swuensis]